MPYSAATATTPPVTATNHPPNGSSATCTPASGSRPGSRTWYDRPRSAATPTTRPATPIPAVAAPTSQDRARPTETTAATTPSPASPHTPARADPTTFTGRSTRAARPQSAPAPADTRAPPHPPAPP